jgi:hypothetical protein
MSPLPKLRLRIWSPSVDVCAARNSALDHQIKRTVRQKGVEPYGDNDRRFSNLSNLILQPKVWLEHWAFLFQIRP